MHRLIFIFVSSAFVIYLLNPSFRTRIYDRVTGIFEWNAASIDQNPAGYLKWNQAQLEQLARQIKTRKLELDYRYERASRRIKFDMRYKQVVDEDLKEAKYLFQSTESRNQWPAQSGQLSLDRQALANSIAILHASSQTTQKRLEHLKLQVEQYPQAKAELEKMLGEIDVALLQLGLVKQKVGDGNNSASAEIINAQLMDLISMSETVNNQLLKTAQRNNQAQRAQLLMNEERFIEILSP
jgi:hypothetical protein